MDKLFIEGANVDRWGTYVRSFSKPISTVRLSMRAGNAAQLARLCQAAYDIESDKTLKKFEKLRCLYFLQMGFVFATQVVDTRITPAASGREMIAAKKDLTAVKATLEELRAVRAFIEASPDEENQGSPTKVASVDEATVVALRNEIAQLRYELYQLKQPPAPVSQPPVYYYQQPYCTQPVPQTGFFGRFFAPNGR